MIQQLPLSSAWQSIGTGPLLVQVVSGAVMIVESATIPSAAATNGTTVSAAVGTSSSSTQFSGSGEYWAKAIATGSVINVAVATSTSGTGGTGGSGNPVSEILLLEDIVTGLAVLGEPAQDGADVAGATMPPGGAGIRGWLSASYGRLAAIAQSLAGTVKTAPQANVPRVIATGALTATGNAVQLAVDGMATAVAQIVGTWAGTVTWSGSIDGGTTWFALSMIPYAGGAASSAAMANGQWECACGGLTHVQAQLTARQSGTAMVTLAAASGVKSLRVGNPAANPLTVAVPDGGSATLGKQADPAATDDVSAFSLVALAKRATGFLASLSATLTPVVSAGTIKISVPGALPLPTGAATEARLVAIQSILQAQTDLATSIWTDNASPKPNYYVRRETLGAGGTPTIVFENADGSTANVTAAGLVPLSSSDALSLVAAYFDATAAGTGIAAGDVLARIVVVNKGAAPPTASSPIWLNLNQGTTLAAAPAAGAYVEQTQHVSVAMPDGAHVTFGSKADAAATSDTGSFTYVALFKRALTYFSVFGASTDAAASSDTGTFGFVALFKRALTYLSVLGTTADAAATSDGGAFTMPALAKRGLGYLGTLASTVGAGATSAMRVATPIPASVVAGQVKIAATGTAVALPAAALANGVVVKASIFNAAQSPTFTAAAGAVGVTTAYDGTGGYPLGPGEAASFACANANLVYVVGQAGDVFGYEGN